MPPWLLFYAHQEQEGCAATPQGADELKLRTGEAFKKG